ncbi:MAG: hypothetical protein IPG71_08330 [bacterium]|nr:hypothetical protein [bacterium]
MSDTRHNFKQQNERGIPSHSVVPENRHRDSLIFRRIRKRIEEGYYESTQVLRDIAYRIMGTRDK